MTAVKRLPAAFLALLLAACFATAALAQIIVIPPGGQIPGGTFTTTNTIRFAQTNYFASEDGIQALITVLREGSLTNADFVSIDYNMLDGTAISGTHYYRTPSTIFFPIGQDRVQFAVPLIDNFSAGGNVFLTLVLRNPGSGLSTFAELGNPNVATLTILDDESSPTSSPAGLVEIAQGNGGSTWDFGIESGTIMATREEWNVDVNNNANFTPYGPAGVQFTVVRKGGSRGKILVDWRTTTNVVPIADSIFFFDFFGGFVQYGGIGVPNEDFIATNGTVELHDYQMSTNVLVRLPANLQNEGWFRGGTNIFSRPPVTFGVELTAVRAAPEESGMGLTPQLGTATQRRIALVDVTEGFAFSRKHYVIREGDRRFNRIRVRRSIAPGDNPLAGVHVHYAVNPRRIEVDAGGDHEGNLFGLFPGSEYSTPFIDYEPPGSPVWRQTMADERLAGRPQTQNDEAPQILWGDGEVTDRFLTIPLIDDEEAEFNEDLQVVLYKHDAETDGFVNPYSRVCTITVVDNDQPAGASEVDFNPDVNPLTDPPYMATPGANNTVQAVAVQPDGKVVLGGDFSAVNTQRREGIARLNFDGSTDFSFNPGSGVSGFVRAVALQPDGKILVGGGFDAVNGITRFSIARLLTNGVVDETFNPGSGADGPIRAVAVQPDGKILIGGEFNSFGGTNVNYFARLNPNGSLDTSFAPGRGPDGPVNSIALTGGYLDVDRETSGGAAEDRFLIDTGSSRGTVTVNFDFLSVPDQLRIYYGTTLIFDTGLISSNGTVTVPYPPAGVAAGSTEIEIVMNEGSGLEGTIWFYSALFQPEIDPRPIIGGEFTEYNGTPINFIARVNVDGSLDRTFNPGTGADDVVYSVAKQGNKVIMAGDFKNVDLRARNGVARLNENGTLDTSFDPGTGFDNTVYSVTVQPNGRAVLGGSFRSFNSTRRIGLARLNLDGSLDTTFMDTARNQFAGIPNPLTPENPESQENFIRSLSAYRLTNNMLLTNQIVDTNGVTNDVISTNFVTTDHLFAGGSFKKFGGGFFRDEIRPRLNIARINGGVTPGPGNIVFLRDSYSVDENAGRTFITLSRTNGSLAPISAQFSAQGFALTGPGIAIDGADFLSTNRFPIWIRSHDVAREYTAAYMGPNFNAFDTNRHRQDFNIYPFPSKPPLRYRNYDDDNIYVDIIDDAAIEGDEVVRLRLTAPDEGRLLLGGEPIPVGTALGRAEALLTISDNDFNFGTLGFSDPQYFVNEDGLDAAITVTRVGGSSGAVTVDVFTGQGGSATIADYNSISRRTLTFANGQTTNRFTIRIKNDSEAELEETVLLFMTNTTGFPNNIPLNQRQDPARSSAVLTIIDDDYPAGRVGFTGPTFSVSETANEIRVTVRRSGGITGDVIVDYATSDGTAKAGEDYTSVSGRLQWTHGDSTDKIIVIPLRGDDVVEGEETINITLSSPGNPEALGSQPTTVIRIQNDDAVGAFSFSQAVYSVDENGPYADIIVVRHDGISGSATVRFSATNLTAVGTTNAAIVRAPNGPPDYVFPEYAAQNQFSNVLSFVEGQTSASFRVPLVDDSVVEGEKQVQLSLFGATGGARLGSTNALLRIIDDELNRIPAGQIDTTFVSRGADDYIYKLALQQDGKILAGGDFRSINEVVRNRLARLNPDGSLDGTYDPGDGPNDSVRALELQSDSRLFVAGLFNSISGTPRNRLARLNVDSKLDPTFNPGAGTDNPIFGVAEQVDGKLVIVGSFSTYRGENRKGIARVNTNGVLDASFTVGTGASDAVWAVAMQADGKILVGGDFTSINGVARNRIARLNRNGSVDTSFGTSDGGANSSVRSIVVQSDGNILIGGFFTNVNGKPFNRVARLRATGAAAGQLDESFNYGFASDAARATNGADKAVSAIALQIDGKILIGGDFTLFNNRTRNRLTRLNSDGSLDPTINFGAGANGTVSDIIVQPDRRILLAGGFTEYDGSPARHIARIHGGSLSGSGSIQFSTPFFRANETEANALVTVRRVGGTVGTVGVDFLTITNDTAIPGLDFTMVTNRLEFPEAETFRTVLIPLRRNTNALEDRFVTAIITNAFGGALIGVQPNARVTLANVDSQLEFSATDYSISEDFVTGAASITVRRIGSTVGPLTVDFDTINLTATAGSDYGAVNATLAFDPGQSSRTFSIPIFDDTVVEGNEQVRLRLSNLLGEGSITRSNAILTIVENDFSPGQIEFASATYIGTEGTRQIIIRLRRVGGTTGVISVDYATRPGGENPAQTPSDYIDKSGIVSFSDGEELQSFVIEVFDDSNGDEGNESFIVSLSNPKGGATIRGATEALAIIVDDDLPSGSLDTDFDPGSGANGSVRTILLDGLDILIGGDFTVYNGVNRSRIARLNEDASVDDGFDPGDGPNGTVADIAMGAEGRLILGGNFNTVQGSLLNRVARLRADGIVDPSFGLPLGLNAEVTEVVRQPDGKILIGGMFDVASAAGRNHIARLNADGTVDIGFNPGVGTDGNVNALLLQADGKVVIGGAFATVNGVSRRGLARLNSDGSVDSAFNSGGVGTFGGAVNDILQLDGGKLLVVGDFTSYNGTNRTRAVIVNADGTLDPSFNTGVGPNRVIYAVAPQPDGKFLIVGDFTSVSGATRNRVARLNADGSHDLNFKPGNGANAAVLAVAVQPGDGKILIGGRFTEFANVARSYIARLNNDRQFITPRDVMFAPVTRVNGYLQLTINTQAGFTYTLQSQTELGGTWKSVASEVATGAATSFAVTPSESAEFFRVVRE